MVSELQSLNAETLFPSLTILIIITSDLCSSNGYLGVTPG